MKLFKIFYHVLVLLILVGIVFYTPPPSEANEAQALSDRCQSEDREACLSLEILFITNKNPENLDELFEDFSTLLKNGTLTDDPRMFSPIIHEVGMELAFNKIPPNEAFDYCPLNFKAGCLHGVVMQYLDEVATEDAQELFSFCGFTKEDEFFYANCIHGVGHELAAKTSGDLETSLGKCQALDLEWQHACSTGVFMEYSTGVHGTGHHTHEPAVGSILLPCEEVSEHFKGSCYSSLSAYRQYLPNTEPFTQTAETCNAAPEKYQAACLLGLAEKIYTDNAEDLNESKKVCDEFNESIQDPCKSALDQIKNLESVL